jgi:hypothetical protein
MELSSSPASTHSAWNWNESVTVTQRTTEYAPLHLKYEITTDIFLDGQRVLQISEWHRWSTVYCQLTWRSPYRPPWMTSCLENGSSDDLKQWCSIDRPSWMLDDLDRKSLKESRVWCARLTELLRRCCHSICTPHEIVQPKIPDPPSRTIQLTIEWHNPESEPIRVVPDILVEPDFVWSFVPFTYKPPYPREWTHIPKILE